MRILLVAHPPLLGDILENLFSSMSDSYIKRIASNDKDTVLNVIAQYQPDIILLDETLKLEYPNHLLAQLLHLGHSRLILTNHQDNRVDVYDKFSATLSQAADLITLTMTRNPLGS